MTTTVLEFDNVSKAFGPADTTGCALSNIDLAVTHGESVAIVGASGSGKTTLLNLSAGLTQATRGTVRLLGLDAAAHGEASLARLRRTKVGFVFQTLNLLPTLTAGENIELPLLLNGWSARDRRQRVRQLLDAHRLGEKAASRIDRLSAGEQQRIAVARAVAHRPAIVFMDEPTSCLDADHARALADRVQQLHADEGLTLIVATHDPQVVRRMGRTVRLQNGLLQ